MKKRVALVGGGHAHLTILKNLDRFKDRGHRVSVISPTTHHYYSGMGPGLLSGTYRPQEIRFHVKKMVADRGGDFILGKVNRVSAEERVLFTDTDKRIEYDVVSFNTGSQVPLDGVSDSATDVFPVKPIDHLLEARGTILDRMGRDDLRLAVVGGGPAGLELAGNLRQLVNHHDGSARITLFAGTRLLDGVPEKVRRYAKQALSHRQVAVVEGDRVKKISKGRLIVESGKEYAYDVMLLAWGIRPSPLFKDSGLLTDADGGLLVNEYLQSIQYPEIFGGGDCIGFQKKPLDKVGVYPVRENPVLFHNLLAAADGEALMPFEPQDRYLLIFNVGHRKGIFWKKNWIWQGGLAFRLKDYIDRTFMKKFQLSNELNEAI